MVKYIKYAVKLIHLITDGLWVVVNSIISLLFFSILEPVERAIKQTAETNCNYYLISLHDYLDNFTKDYDKRIKELKKEKKNLFKKEKTI